MKIKGKDYRTIWLTKGKKPKVRIIDQRFLPHQFIVTELNTVIDVVDSINNMAVRGAPLIGVAAAYGMYLAALNAPSDKFEETLSTAASALKSTRPTAVNLTNAVDCVMKELAVVKLSLEQKTGLILRVAERLAEESIEQCLSIGLNFQTTLTNLNILKNTSANEFVKIAHKIHFDYDQADFSYLNSNNEKQKESGIASDKYGVLPVMVLTHCNAGWLACIDYGTALAPVYIGRQKGIPIHVWVVETRPRNQGASLTAFELKEEGVPHTVIADNAAGYLMQKGFVDVVIVGADRIARNGDVANKIGTYTKALAAKDNGIQFYVAAPSSTIDWGIKDGSEIPIEKRDENEVRKITGMSDDGEIRTVLLTPKESHALNYAFDITPSRLITGIITERGICEASEKGLLKLFPEKTSR
jgi:methylthioribose-1-phosphate isomerase